MSICMLCSSNGFQFVSKLRDDASRDVMQCDECGHVQVIPLPTVEEDAEFYNNNDMLRLLIPKSEMSDLELMDKYEVFADWQVRKTRPLIPPGTSIMEIGSGYGWYVRKMRDLGYDAAGIELSKEKRDMARERLGVRLFDTDLFDETAMLAAASLGKYDFVCMYHVLEHIVKPEEFVRAALRFAKQDGKLVIMVPNLDDYNKGITQAYRDFSFLRAHVSYFSQKTLKYFLKEKCGLTDVAISGDQMYGVENAIHWARHQKPFKEYCQVDLPAGLEFVNDYYRNYLESSLRSHALMAVGSVP